MEFFYGVFHGVFYGVFLWSLFMELKKLRQMPYCLKSKKKAVVLTPQRPQGAITPLTPLTSLTSLTPYPQKNLKFLYLTISAA